jgi:hypothetical protein
MLETVAFTGALSGLGAIIKVADESKRVEMTNNLIELQKKIVGIQAEFGEMQQKLSDLQQKNRELTDSVASRTPFEYRFNMLWKKKEGGGYTGPFCPICKANGKEALLRQAPGYDTTKDWYHVACSVFHQRTSGRPNTPIIYQILKSDLPEGW